MIEPIYDPKVGRMLTEADVVWEEVTEMVDLAMTYVVPYEGTYTYSDLGAFQREVTSEVEGWNPAAQQAFVQALTQRLIEAGVGR